MPDNLPQLRDIHIPDGVSIFPLAYGWWVILAAILACVGLVYGFILLRRQSKKLYALYLLNKVENDNLVKAAAAMSEILRRICVYKYPEAVGVSGEEWIKFLEAHGKDKMSDKERELLLNSPYMPEDIGGFEVKDISNLRDFCSRWIGENL